LGTFTYFDLMLMAKFDSILLPGSRGDVTVQPNGFFYFYLYFSVAPVLSRPLSRHFEETAKYAKTQQPPRFASR
jgi:hypothetical protein